MNSKTRWRLAGIVAITILGFLLHYLFNWTGESGIIGLFVPVNESVWEHLKLGYWSVVLFSVVEYFQIKHRVNNYFLAKAIGVIALEMTILIIFYGYTFFTGRNIVLIDIISYFLGAVLCQYLVWIFLELRPFPKRMNRLGLAAFIAIGILFGVTTYYPPHMELFQDHNGNTYGINKDK